MRHDSRSPVARHGTRLGTLRASLAIVLVFAAAAPLAVLAQTAPAQAVTTVMTPHRTAADTGRMAWGHQDYSNYSTAAQCDRAVAGVTAEVWRTRSTDTMEYVPGRDTLPTAAKTVAQACGARFASETADLRDLWSIMRLSLALGDDARARAAVERQLRAETKLVDSAVVLRWAVGIAMARHPVRVALAREWLARLDALGRRALLQRYDARLLFLSYWYAAFDADSLRTTADAAITLLAEMSAEDRDETDDVFAPFVQKFGLANLMQDVAAQQAVINSGLKHVGSWRSGNGASWFMQMQAMLDMQKQLYGKATRPLSTSHMFNTGGVGRPAPGRPALIVVVDPSCGPPCFSQYATLRRLAERHPDLDVTLVTGTNGYGRGTGPLTVDEEAKFDARYFLDFLKIPAGLIVEESPSSRLPDGRIQRRPGPIAQMFGSWLSGDAVLVDRDGKVRWFGVLSSASDARIAEAAIARLSGSGQGR